GPLAEQDPVSGLYIERNELSGLVPPAGADRDNLAFLRLLLRGIGDDDSTLGLLFGFDAAHDDAVVQGTKLGLGHDLPLGCLIRRGGAANLLSLRGFRNGWHSEHKSANRRPEIGSGPAGVKSLSFPRARYSSSVRVDYCRSFTMMECVALVPMRAREERHPHPSRSK